MRRIILPCLILSISVLFSSHAISRTPTLQEFGFEADRPASWPRQNLLVLRYVGVDAPGTSGAAAAGNYARRFSSEHTRDFFEDRYFDRRSGLSAFLGQMTSTNFQFVSDLGVMVSPNIYNVVVPTLHPRPGVVMRKDLLLQADQDIRFSELDANNDGVITNDELTIMMVAPTTTNVGGTSRPVDTTNDGCLNLPNNRIRLCIQVAAVGASASLNLIAHELLHTFGSKDLYGLFNSRMCLNSPSSLMGCGRTLKSQLDPWHKMRFGWARPRLISLDEPYRCEPLVVRNITARSPKMEPLLIFSEERGVDEFFLLEFRNKAPSRLTGSFNIDEGLSPDQWGVAIWHIKTNNGALKQYDAFIGPPSIPPGTQLTTTVAPGSDDRVGTFGTTTIRYIDWGKDHVLQSSPQGRDAIQTHWANNIVNAPSGDWGTQPNTYWKSTHGSFRLRWHDGSDVGMAFQVEDVRNNSDQIQIYMTRDGSENPPIANARFRQCYTDVTKRNGDFGWSDADAVFHAIDPNGGMVWYRHLAKDTGNPRWAGQGDQRVLREGKGPGKRWDAYKKVVSAGEGVIYAIKNDGSLVWYRNLGWQTGDNLWANNGDEVELTKGVGAGTRWSGLKDVVAGDKGVLYGIKHDGSLVWYRHLGWEDGSKNWANNGKEFILADGDGLGSGWAGFKDVVAGGEGVLYGIKHDGSLVWYRHLGWEDGSKSWEYNGLEREVADGEWNKRLHVMSPGKGYIYAVNDKGVLEWYYHRGWLDGTDRWDFSGRSLPASPPGVGGSPGSGWSRYKTILVSG